MNALVERAGFSFIPAQFQYSNGVVAKPGFMIERARFTRPIPLAEGFARIEVFLRAEGHPLTALCACELRSPGQFTDAGFIAFNRLYVGTLERWGIFANDVNPVARSNVCPEIAPPSTPSFYAFCYVHEAAGAPPSFVAAGSGEARGGTEPYSERTIRYGETTPDAMTEKVRFVVGEMERRMGAMGTDWSATTANQVYAVHDFHAAVGPEIVARGAAPHGIDWHYCRPPVLGLEFEMDTRAVYRERVLAS